MLGKADSVRVEKFGRKIFQKVLTNVFGCVNMSLKINLLG